MMKLMHERQTILAAIRGNMSYQTAHSKDPIVDPYEMKENKSSNGSLLVMNPVASGDNVTKRLSAPKLKDDLPSLIPCCEGRELEISEDLISTGLSAISVRHDAGLIQSLSTSRACERMQVPPGLVKHRNSFRCLHRPDLKRVPYLRRMTPDELESLFKGYSDFPTRANKSDNFTEGSRLSLPPENITKELKKDAPGQDDGNGLLLPLHPIPETHSGADDVPAGMRLHGARARLYTSVLAGAKAGDQLDGNVSLDEYDIRVSEDLIPEDEVALNEELQIILPPRTDEIAIDTPSNTTTSS